MASDLQRLNAGLLGSIRIIHTLYNYCIIITLVVIDLKFSLSSLSLSLSQLSLSLSPPLSPLSSLSPLSLSLSSPSSLSLSLVSSLILMASGLYAKPLTVQRHPEFPLRTHSILLVFGSNCGRIIFSCYFASGHSV